MWPDKKFMLYMHACPKLISRLKLLIVFQVLLLRGGGNALRILRRRRLEIRIERSNERQWSQNLRSNANIALHVSGRSAFSPLELLHIVQ